MSAAFTAGEAAGSSRGADGFAVAPLPSRAPAPQTRKPTTGTTQIYFTARETVRRTLPVAAAARGDARAKLPSRALAPLSQQLGASPEIGDAR
ncbi:hypothetical protein [Streptomyces sp. NPDC021622]|uniref:hypothetical protein n=1 Tax=Streptomyces sp. NPDC021622 TaxID=3155013 RepID=UPI0033EF33F5